MANYQAQLQLVLDALRRRQRTGEGPHTGGWGALIEPEAPSSIVNTAEAVSVFALAGARPDDDALCDGLRYLREKVVLHPRPVGSHPEARGNKTRYAAFGLMGLTACSQPIENEEHTRAIAACVLWLGHNILDEGLDVEHFGQGWSEHPGRRTVSLLSTSIAAQALDKVPIGTPAAEHSRVLASHARRRIRALARGDERRRWWPVRADAEEALGDEAAGAAVTALAVLALAEGGARSQSYARAGVHWLLEHTERWEQQREPEENVPDANWIHASNPLCLRAVLSPCAGIDPQRPELAAAISHLELLWYPQAGEWRHGHPAAEVSTSADLHAAAAIRAMRRGWKGFDPTEHLLGGDGRRTAGAPALGGDKPHEVRWASHNRTLTVCSADGTVLAKRQFAERASGMRALLDALTSSWEQAGAEASHFERSLTTAEIELRTGIRDVPEYVRRLNRAVGEASREQRGRSCVIVERIESGHGVREDRYALLGRRLVLE